MRLAAISPVLSRIFFRCWVLATWSLGLASLAFGQGAEPVILSGILAPVNPIRIGSRVELSVFAIGDSPLFYFWFRNGELIESISDPVIVLDPFSEGMSGKYDALVVNEFGYGVASTAELIPEIRGLPFTDAFDARAGGQGEFPNQIFGREGSGRGSNVGATFQGLAGEPEHALFPGGRSVWVSWMADATGVAKFGTEGSSFDTVLAVYEARDPVRPTLDNLVEVASNDDSDFDSDSGLSAKPSSLVLFNARAGTRYFIAVDGFGIAGDTGPSLPELSESGNIVLSWVLEETNEVVPDFISSFSDENVDLGGALSFDGSVEASGATRTEWQWWYEDQPLAGVTTSQLNLQNVSRNQVGTYFCETRNVYANTTRSARSIAVDVQIAERSDGVDKGLQAEDRFVDARRARMVVPRRGGAPAAARAKRPGNLQGLAAGSSGSQIFSTKNASKESGEPVHCGIGGGRSKWFTVAPNVDGVLVADTQGSDFDTVLAAYVDNGQGVGLFDGLVNVGCNNDAPGLGKASRVVLLVKAGTVYFLAVDGVREAVGIAQLNFSLQNALGIAQPPLNQNATVGSAVTLSVVASGVGLLKYQWRKAGQPILGATQAEFRIATVAFADAGDYSVVVMDDLTSVTSAVAKLTVAGTSVTKLSLIRTAGTSLLLRGNASAGEVWRIESSRDLRNWDLVALVTASGAGFEVQQTNAGANGSVVFRAVKR